VRGEVRGEMLSRKRWRDARNGETARGEARRGEWGVVGAATEIGGEEMEATSLENVRDPG
jgi:hypothetical protein